MATLAPNLYILEYLKAIGKLTPSTQQRAKRNLKIGKHNNTIIKNIKVTNTDLNNPLLFLQAEKLFNCFPY